MNVGGDKFPVRLSLEQAGGSAKMALDMMSTDTMAELRAEVTQWWCAIHSHLDAPPPFRILAQGKEIGKCHRDKMCFPGLVYGMRKKCYKHA